MITTVFDYYLSDDDFILVRASAKDVDKWADGLEIQLPKNMRVTDKVRAEIEALAVIKLREEKSNNK